LLVVGGAVVTAAPRTRPGGGDGVHTVRAGETWSNQDPKRGTGHAIADQNPF
jgi:hypothetical protein